MDEFDFIRESNREEDLYITDWEKLVFNFCIDAASLSKCAAKKVSAVIADDNTIYSTGINGTFSGHVNCNDIFKKEEGIWYYYENGDWVKSDDPDIHHKWSSLNEIHAEVNALTKMNRLGIDTRGKDLYCSHSPCFNCAKSIILAGISRIFFRTPYGNENEFKLVAQFLKEHNVDLLMFNEEQDD